PSIKHDRAGRAAAAEATSGKRSAKSLPWRVMSRTPAPSRRARMRKPGPFLVRAVSLPYRRQRRPIPSAVEPRFLVDRTENLVGHLAAIFRLRAILVGHSAPPT